MPLVAVTGAGGLLGRAVLADFARRGWRTRVLTRGHAPLLPGTDATALPPPEAPLGTFIETLRGADHLVHAAALNNGDRRAGDAAYKAPNVVLTAKLAAAGAAALPGRMVFISSIRAVAGPLFDGTIRDDTEAAPVDAYGRSKREGELAALDAFRDEPGRLAILRPAPIYGKGMRGALGALLRIADSPLPLPLAGLAGRRPLVADEAVARAVAHLLTAPAVPRSAMCVSDLSALTLAEIAAAFRAGLERPSRLFRLPASGVLGAAARLAGKGGAWRALAVRQICEPQTLIAGGWAPVADSRPGLAEVARRSRQA